MLTDHWIPSPLRPVPTRGATLHGVHYTAAVWEPERLAEIGRHLETRGARTLREISTEDLLHAWGDTVEAFLDPLSPERQGLDPPLAALCRLSPQGLAAGLAAVLGGVRREPASRLAVEARPHPDPRPVLVLLASNLPALAVQPLLPALLLRRPVILKSPSTEPLFTPAFLAALARREPRLEGALVALTWRGGDQDLEAPLLAAAGKILAYGEEETLNDLRRRAPGKVLGYGPKASLAVMGADASPEAVTPGLARDIALFDQRGCLSLHAVYAEGEGRELAEALARALAEAARGLPPGPLDPALAAAVQQLRAEADLLGHFRPPLDLTQGTVLLDPRPGFRPSPGLRTVRVHPLPDLSLLPEILEPWRGRLQGVALAGEVPKTLRPTLESLGTSRFAPPGHLQSPDATWHNGGLHPLKALGG